MNKGNIWSAVAVCSLLFNVVLVCVYFYPTTAWTSLTGAGIGWTTFKKKSSDEGIGALDFNKTHVGMKHFLKDYKNPCWREEGRLKCVPYFYTPGFGKSGSTSLFKTITLHPDIIPPYMKELDGWGAGNVIENMVQKLTMNHMMQSLTNSTDKNGFHYKFTGDGTPRYIWNLKLPHFLYSLFHGTKIIIIMRHPTDRFFSHYSHQCRLAGLSQSAQRLHKAVAETIKQIHACSKSKSKMVCVLQTVPSDGGYCHGGAIKLSVYMAYLPTWLEGFPRDQVLLLEYEQFFNDTVTGSYLIFKFLGLAAADEELRRNITEYNEEPHVNAPIDNHKNLLPATRTLLDQFYAPFNKILADYLKDDRFLFLRRNSILPPK